MSEVWGVFFAVACSLGDISLSLRCFLFSWPRGYSNCDLVFKNKSDLLIDYARRGIIIKELSRKKMQELVNSPNNSWEVFISKMPRIL